MVESFLAARDAHDALTASAFCADLLAINDADGQSWLGDARAVNSWLQQLIQAYSIDMLERPHADGEHIVWTERLSSRAAPFKDALASRIDVRVEVLVRAGKITTYSAWYPSAPPNSPIRTRGRSCASRSRCRSIPARIAAILNPNVTGMAC